MSEANLTQAKTKSERQWSSLSRIQRRVAGVLVEKSKTTPAAYPLSLNAIKVACNQKSNRSPLMNLNETEVEDTLYQLRHLGAVIEVHSGGRIPKYKHQLYEWLGVEKVELGVMAELLLRGEQSLGDLRARVARMESVAGLEELKPIVAALLEKQLVVEITPPGRGQIVTHNLYQPEELERIRAAYADGVPPESSGSTSQPLIDADPELANRIEELEGQVDKLWQTVNELRAEIDEIKA